MQNRNFCPFCKSITLYYNSKGIDTCYACFNCKHKMIMKEVESMDIIQKELIAIIMAGRKTSALEKDMAEYEIMIEESRDESKKFDSVEGEIVEAIRLGVRATSMLELLIKSIAVNVGSYCSCNKEGCPICLSKSIDSTIRTNG